MEQGEKNYKVLHRSWKISSFLLGDNGENIKGIKPILSKLSRFHKNLYTSKISANLPGINKFSAENLLDEEESNILDVEITLDECYDALKDLQSGKTPGSDGLTAEFYRWLVDIIIITEMGTWLKKITDQTKKCWLLWKEPVSKPRHVG